MVQRMPAYPATRMRPAPGPPTAAAGPSPVARALPRVHVNGRPAPPASPTAAAPRHDRAVQSGAWAAASTVAHEAPPAPTLPVPAALTPAAARPEPTRTAVLAAYQQAIRALPAAPTAPAAAAPAPAPAIRPAPMTTVSVLARSVSTPTPAAPLFTPFGISRLQRAEMQNGPAPQPEASSNGVAKPEPPDLDLLADYVLERLRHELRDGRERLGFLLDDSR